MKTTSGRFAIIACLFVTFANAPVNATPAVWTNGAGSNAWETAGNWDINMVPNNNTFDVMIPISAPCDLTGQFQIGALDLSYTAAILNLVPGAELAFSNNVINNGTILVNTTGANNTTRLRFAVNGEINGGGHVILNGVGFNVATIYLGAQTVTNGTGHVILGKGTIIGYDGGTLINNGSIEANDPAGSLQLDLGGTANENRGNLMASGGGLLGLFGGTLNQFDMGIFVAVGAGSLVVFAANGNNVPTVIGGTLLTNSGGLIEADRVTLQGVSLQGALQIPPGGLISVTGAGLTNNGTILINTTGENNTAQIRFDTTGPLGGTGSVTLNGIGFNVATIYLGANTVTNEAGHTIRGKGTIIGFDGGTLSNNGTIVGDDSAGNMQLDLGGTLNTNTGMIKAANGGSLGLFGGTITQNGKGTFLADGTGSRVILAPNGNISTTIIGGLIDSEDGGLIEADQVTLQSVTNKAAVQIPANGTVIVKDSLQNDGEILVNTTAAKMTTVLRFDTGTNLTGSGRVLLNGSGFNNANLSVNNVSVSNEAGHTIGGTGDVFIDGGNAALMNDGIIAPGDPTGQINYRGLLTLGLTSNLFFEIGGTIQGAQYDFLFKSDIGPLTLNGNLTVGLINNFTPTTSDTFTIVTTQVSTPANLGGAFNNVPSGGHLNTVDGTGSFIVTYHVPNDPVASSKVVLSNFGPPIVQLLNISTRMPVLTGDNVLIGGFIVTGVDPKRVIVRGIGPSLANQGVPGALPDTTLELHDGSGAIIATNDNWRDTQEAEIIATGIPPTNDLESAIVATLPANNSAYTAILSGKNGTTGAGLVEVYDLVQSANSRLANVSTRGFVNTGDNVLIGGIIVGPVPDNATRVLVRAIGPSLSNLGVPDALQDPTLELHDGSGSVIAFNNNWKDTQQTEIEATGLAPTADAESAILTSVPPGNYTAVVRGVSDTVGVGLVEAYDLR